MLPDPATPLEKSPLQFYKYHAYGNDMIVIDPATFAAPLSPDVIRAICRRHFGLGADGICYGPLPGDAYPMRFFNPDGSEAEKSGNGLRIFARYLWDQGYVSDRAFTITINNERIDVWVEDERAQTMTTTMGRITFDSAAVPVAGSRREVVAETIIVGEEMLVITAVSVGNPHCVIFEADLSMARVQALGPLLETDDHFPNRTNIQFAQVLNEHTLRIEIWERGAGYTLASGSSATAAAAAAIRTGRCRSPVEVRMAGGTARVVLDEQWRARLTGTVTAVAQGVLAYGLVNDSH